MSAEVSSPRVSESILKKHGLRSISDLPTAAKLREMAAAFIAAADETEKSS